MPIWRHAKDWQEFEAPAGIALGANQTLLVADADLGEVIRASERAKDTVRQILSFSRRSPIERKPIDLRQLVEEALRFECPAQTNNRVVKLRAGILPNACKKVPSCRVLVNLARQR